MMTQAIALPVQECFRELVAGGSRKNTLVLAVGLILLSKPAFAADGETAPSKGYLNAGVGIVDITPTGRTTLVGGTVQWKTSSVRSRLYVKALVLAAGGQKVAIVTLDILKYPVEHAVQVRRQVERTSGISASNVIICPSHTHNGPFWTDYKDVLVTPIAEAVALAVRDLTPCRLGVSKGKTEGVSECRRVIKDGQTWGRWVLPPAERGKYPPEGPVDPEFDVLAVIGKDGRYKAVVYNFACHAANSMRTHAISADYPGDVQQYVRKHLGYEVQTLFLTGACGDVNPVSSLKEDVFGERLGGEIVRCLGRLEPIANPAIYVECRELAMPGREHPELTGKMEEDMALKWPGALKIWKSSFHWMKEREKPTYQFCVTGIRIGDNFAIVTNPDELFCGISMSIKKQSPFKHTMVVEQTNGAYGYVPTAKAFEGGGYETWFGEHSYLTTRAGEIIEKESLSILNRLKRAE